MQNLSTKLSKQIKNYVYSIDAKIGKGFSSNVYKGTNIQNNQEVAIKVIDLRSIKNDVQRMLLSNQIKSLKLMDHQNVIKTFQICQTANNVYMISENCEQGDLLTMIKNKGKYNQQQALRIFQQITKGVSHIHMKGIIHRDLKSANILIKNNVAKIGDFGFAQFYTQNKVQSFYNVGSPLYMSPQAYRNTRYSFKSDCWAIGIILYEMLIGEQPFKGISYDAMLKSISSGQIYHNINASGFLKMLLSRLLSIDVERRIQINQILRLLKSNQSQIMTEPAMMRPYSQILLNDTECLYPISYYPQSNTMKHVQTHNHVQNNIPFGRKTLSNISNIVENSYQKLHNTTVANKEIKMLKNNNPSFHKIQLGQFLVVFCSSLLQFDMSQNIKRLLILAVKHLKNLIEQLELSVNKFQYQHRYKQLVKKFNDYLIFGDSSQIKNDTFLQFLVKSVKPQNQLFLNYLQFWLKLGLTQIQQLIKTKNINCDGYQLQLIYSCQINILKYYEILENIKLKYSNNMQNIRIDALFNEKQNLTMNSFEKLTEIAKNIIRI